MAWPKRLVGARQVAATLPDLADQHGAKPFAATGAGDRWTACPAARWERAGTVECMDTSGTPLICSVAIDTLRDGPDLRALDDAHIERLTEVLDDLPPVIVEATTGAVIDGKHRVEAARRRRRLHVDARLVQLAPGEALAAAAHLNSRHGLPLTMEEKKTAAHRLLQEDPSRSNGLVGRLVGLSPSTIGRIRSRSGWSVANLNGARMGVDGKTYPTDGDQRRRDVERLLCAQPGRSLRSIARDVARQSDGTRALPRGRDHLGVLAGRR